jgi:hypothetical protein
MKVCSHYQNLIKKLQTEKLNKDEEATLKEHANSCSECAELLNIHIFLQQAGSFISEPEELAFNQLRQSVLSKLKHKKSEITTKRSPEFFDNIRIIFTRPEMAIAAVTLILGFFLGRLLPPSKDNISSSVVKQIHSFAQTNKQLNDVQNSPYSFSNIYLDKLDDETIAMKFDVNIHVDLVREKNDPLVRDVLTHALLNQSNVGLELKSISFTENIMDKKIKEALILLLNNAPFLSVRLKAMQSLMNYKMDESVHEAFINVLQEEESVKMKLLAIDYFEENILNPDKVESVVAGIDPIKDKAILIRAQKLLKVN